jgi:dTDP-4-dehydrorhamnose 3,5-epimerase
MHFTETALSGAYLVEPEMHRDVRGFFARTFCEDEFSANGLSPHVAQCSLSYNERKGTLRGMHYQAPPGAEAKLIRCTRGSIHDVIVDLRRSSSTFRKWIAIELSAANRRMLFVPEGIAHGFQSLEDGVEVFYQISIAYRPEAARGVRWNDPAFAIEWPLPNPVLSDRDASFPDFSEERCEFS